MNARPRVLVVEDEPSLAQLVALQLDAAGYDSIAVTTGEDALIEAGRGGFAAILLDLGLAGALDGIEVARTLRARGDWTPIIVVTARDDEIDRVLGLELGADDYVTKPYSPRELIARVRAHVRRESARGTARRLSAGALVLDLDAHAATLRGAEVALTPTEFGLLAYLLERPRRVCTRGELLQHVWGYPDDDTTRTVDTHVAQLRAKLGDDSPIRTVRGVGYGVVGAS